jgi:hypothetical protein
MSKMHFQIKGGIYGARAKNITLDGSELYNLLTHGLLLYQRNLSSVDGISSNS